jgi:hypothetical protein
MAFPYERFKDMIGFLYVAVSVLIGVSATLISNADLKGSGLVMVVYTPFVISFLALIASTGIFMDVALMTGGKEKEKEKDTWYSRNSNMLTVRLVQLALISSLITIFLLLIAKVWVG